MTTSNTGTNFSSLPTEIRLLIWHLALPSHRLIGWNQTTMSISPQPIPLLSICHESRAVVERAFTTMIHRHYVDKPFYINTETDAIHYNLLACHNPEYSPRVTTSDSREMKQVKRVWVDSLPGSLRGRITNFYNYVLTVSPTVEEIIIVMTGRKGGPAILEVEREDFLRFLKRNAGWDLWDQEGLLLSRMRSLCYSRHAGVAGYVWRMPRVVLDIEAFVVDSHVKGRRRACDLNLVKGEPDAELSSRWESKLFG